MVEPSLASDPFLICRSDTRLCALPLESVAETMRPLPLQPIADMPAFLLGISIIRGAAIPVLNGAMLVGARPDVRPARYVTLKAGERRVCLAVQDVIGVRQLPRASLTGVPLLLQDADANIVSAIGTLDAELLIVLQSAHLLPERIWSELEGKLSAS